MKRVLEFIIRNIIGYPSKAWKRHYIKTNYPGLCRFLYEKET